ncbi:MAG: helix-turn-helix domain-containing protein [Janthinobacterium lividum]
MKGQIIPLRRLPPAAALAPFVRTYEERNSEISGDRMLRPLTAKPEQFLEFYLRDRYCVRAPDGTFSVAPRANVVGVHTRPGGHLLLTGRLHVFTIQFQPTGFHALFGTPQGLLTNLATCAGDLMCPSEISSFTDRLTSAEHMAERSVITNGWLLARLARLTRVSSPVSWASRVMVRTGGRIRIDALVERSGLGARQFERRFHIEVGTQPKRYARILRLRCALRLRRADPSRSWTGIAVEAGYSDQAHMIHEFRALSGDRPANVSAALGDALA